MKFQSILLHKAAFLTLLFIPLFSCECNRTAHGLVLDKTTQLPIDSVLVKGLESVYYDSYSDETGNYFMTTGMIGAVGGCPDMKISFSKEGYYDITVVNPGEDIIYMIKK